MFYLLFTYRFSEYKPCAWHEGHRGESVIDSIFAGPVAKETDNYNSVLQELRRRKLRVGTGGEAGEQAPGRLQRRR